MVFEDLDLSVVGHEAESRPSVWKEWRTRCVLCNTQVFNSLESGRWCWGKRKKIKSPGCALPSRDGASWVIRYLGTVSRQKFDGRNQIQGTFSLQLRA